MTKSMSLSRNLSKSVVYIVSIFLAVLSIFPFWIMFINATRGTFEIQQNSIALLPSVHLIDNFRLLMGKSFNPVTGFMNSMIMASGATICAVYFSSLTAYGLVAFNWKWRQPFFTFIMAVLMIPAQVSELDPGRAYIPSSSPIRKGRFAVGNPSDRAALHEDGLFSAFKEHTPSFMSEFGFQSYPEIRTLEPVTSAGGPDRESIDSRQTNKVDSRLVDTYMKRLYPEYKDYESFLVLSQLLQAEGMKVAIENMRIDQPNCMGSMYWQLNDCWPGPSSSTVDYDGRWKALQFWMQHLYAPIMLLAEQNEKGDLRVRATSDEPRTRYGTIALRLKSFEGDILWTQEQTVQIVPDSVKVYMQVPRSIFPDRFDRSTTVLEIILHARGKILASNLLYFAQPKEMELPDPEFSYRVTLAEGGDFMVEVRADHHLKNVEFALEGVEAEFSDNYFDLPPGGIREIAIKAPSIKTEKEMMTKLRVRQLLDWVK